MHMPECKSFFAVRQIQVFLIVKFFLGTFMNERLMLLC